MMIHCALVLLVCRILCVTYFQLRIFIPFRVQRISLWLLFYSFRFVEHAIFYFFLSSTDLVAHSVREIVVKKSVQIILHIPLILLLNANANAMQI